MISGRKIRALLKMKKLAKDQRIKFKSDRRIQELERNINKIEQGIKRIIYDKEDKEKNVLLKI